MDRGPITAAAVADTYRRSACEVQADLDALVAADVVCETHADGQRLYESDGEGIVALFHTLWRDIDPYGI